MANANQGVPCELHVHNGSCVHSKCVGHEPDWEQIGEKRIEPAPRLWGLKKNYTLTRCCGRAMQRMQEVVTHVCKICGRQKEHVVNWYLARCSCCGRTEDMLKGGPWD
jgi:hypothetical protein